MLRLRFAVIPLLVPIVPSAMAAGNPGDRLDIAAERVELEGMVLEGVAVELLPDGASGVVSVARLVSGDTVLEAVVLDCAAIVLTRARFACRGSLELIAEATGPATAELLLDYDIETGAARFDASTTLFGVQFALAGEYRGGHVEGTFDAERTPLAPFAAEFAEGYTVHGGDIDFAGRFEQPAGGDLALEVEFEVQGLGFDNPEGTIAAADLALAGQGSFSLAEAGPTFDLVLRRSGGELLLGSLYLDLNQAAPQLEASGQLLADQLRLDRLQLEDGEALSLTAAGSYPLAGDHFGSWQVELRRAQFPAVHDRYLANLLQTLGWSNLQTAGQVRGDLSYSDGAVQHATLDFSQVRVDDAGDRFAIEGLDGLVDYDAVGDSADSQVSWRSASLYRVLLGAGEARFLVAGDEFQLLEPLAVDIFDGQLNVQTLAVRDMGADDMELDFEAEIEPISLRPLTEALGWPTMSGNLSGQIPRVELRNQVAEFGGALRLNVFDGVILAENLVVERLFGVLPTLAADITMDNLDLQLMTGTFDFGEIQGRLDGAIAGLRLLDWQPVAFDLDLHTPPEDRSRHRISQRAVNDISSIGGGPSALLSSTFLRFFDDFRYDRLGLTCQLAQNVCRMGGAKPAPDGGFYIIIGSGVPRIDVIGHNRLVNFPELLARVEAVTKSGAPTVSP